MTKRRKRSNKNKIETPLAHWIGSILILLVILTPAGVLGSHLYLKESVIEFYIIATVLGFLFFNRNYRLSYPKHVLALSVVILVAWGALSLLWAEKPGFAIVHLVRWLTVGLIGLAVFQLRNSRDLLILARYAFFAGCLVTALGCMQYITGFDGIPQARGPAATFANRNVAMHIVILTWWFGPMLMLLEANRGEWRHYGYALGTALAIVFATYTQTRAAWVSMLAQILLVAAFFVSARFRQVEIPTRFNKGAAAFGIIVIIVMLNLGPQGFDPVWSRILPRAATITEVAAQSEGEKPFERFVIWQSTLDMIEDNALTGVGLGNFQSVHPSYAVGDTINITYAHNDYLQTTAELGLLSAVPVLAALGTLVWLGTSVLFFRREEQFLTYSILVLLGGIAVDALFSFPMQLIGGQLLIALLLGMLLRLECPVGTAYLGKLPLNRGYAGLVIALPIATLVFALNIDWRLTFNDFERRARDGSWTHPVDLETFAEHPMYVRFAKALAQQLQTERPARAEMVARSYYRIDDDNVIVNNTLALALILQDKFASADEIIDKTRPLEPAGYFRSWENEQILAGRKGDTARLRATLEELEDKPRNLLLKQAATLNNMAKTAYNLGDGEHAIELLKENLAIHPEHVDTHRTLLTVLARLGRHEARQEHIESLNSYGLGPSRQKTILENDGS